MNPGDRLIYAGLRDDDAHGLRLGCAYTVESIFTMHSRRDHRVIVLQEIPGHVFPLARFEHPDFRRRA